MSGTWHSEGKAAEPTVLWITPVRTSRHQSSDCRKLSNGGVGGREGDTNRKTKTKPKPKWGEKTTCLMGVFFFFFLSLSVYSKFMFFFTSFLWSLHLSLVNVHTLSCSCLFGVFQVFFFFFKNFGFAIGGQC